ncbi:hypothetical protein, partial [Ligilactobacillus animalis]|uniref:hypothetical protein n=1 Tax=Ligilactobacillus animalis TaxID=1605 RepID=UPI003CFA27C1
ARMLNRQGAKGAKEDAKKEFFLCRVDGKGKGFALRRSFSFPFVKTRFCRGNTLCGLAVIRARYVRNGWLIL